MKFQAILTITVLSALALNTQGFAVKSLLKKKLPGIASILPSIGGLASGQSGSIQAGSSNVGSGTIIASSSPLSGTIRPDASSFVSVRAIPSSHRLYSYTPQQQTQVYLRAIQPVPVIQRTVYLEAPRNNLGSLSGILGNLSPALGSLSGLKSIIGNALRPSAAAAAPSNQLTFYSYY